MPHAYALSAATPSENNRCSSMKVLIVVMALNLVECNDCAVERGTRYAGRRCTDEPALSTAVKTDAEVKDVESAGHDATPKNVRSSTST